MSQQQRPSQRSHSGPRPRIPAPDVPQPSFAERTRTLLHRQRTGYLSTLSRRHTGVPFGSVMPYALDAEGRPTFLISKMAMHTQNLDQDPRSCLLVPGEGALTNPLGAERASLLGSTEAVPAGDVATVRDAYLERHPDARHWIDYADFSFYRLSVRDVYFVGGFGVMGWVEGKDYDEASPDPLADAAPGIIDHMNQDHADALQLLAEAFAGLTAEEAVMTAVDRLGFHLRLKVGGHYQGCRIAFPRPVVSPPETRTVMVEMVREARLKANALS